MAELIKHKCIKCGKDYSDTDVDAYLCESCVIEKNKIAREFDSKPRPPTKKVKSEIEIYNDITKATGKPFINARDLGLF